MLKALWFSGYPSHVATILESACDKACNLQQIVCQVEAIIQQKTVIRPHSPDFKTIP
jgi:hypothetical protein